MICFQTGGALTFPTGCMYTYIYIHICTVHRVACIHVQVYIYIYYYLNIYIIYVPGLRPGTPPPMIWSPAVAQHPVTVT